MIVHDMRSPLTVISGSYEIILIEEDRLSPTQQKFIALGQSSCRELIAMASSLLDVSRLESGQMPLNRTPSNLREVAQEAAESVTVMAQHKQLTIHVASDAFDVTVDHDIIRRVFVNLLGNAIKFSPEDGAIEIAIASDGESARATVTDHGPGIPQEYHEKIFEKFGQVDPRKEGKMCSWGLGLTFCKLAVEAHGGRIGIESEVGKGSKFWFTLPNR